MFQEGMNLDEAAGRISPVVAVPADKIAGFVILVIVDDDGPGPAIAASENIPPSVAAILLHDAGTILAQTLAESERLRGCN